MTRTLVWNVAKIGVWCVLATFLSSSQAAPLEPKRYAVQVSAVVQESPPQITLTWPGDPANSYQVSKRTLNSGWQVLATLGSSATSFQDSSVTVGVPYEYRIVKDMGNKNIGYGYIRAAIKAPLVDNHGKVIVLVEQSIANALGAELNQFQQNLVGDGWTVIRSNVSANDSPGAVKNLIRSAWQADPNNVNSVVLIGHVPVPYSGKIFPDGHENHEGAWPADVFYGEMTSNWTDSTVNVRVAERQVNWNVPGDGKFDQSKIPSEVELAVGRIDFWAMTCFANKTPSRSEVDLTRAYLNKNHRWRHGLIQVPRRGLICDNFSDKGDDPIAGSAWRNFPTFFGANNIQEVGWDQFLPAATQNAYLWSYASGGGSYYYSMGVAHSDDFALKNVNVIFSMFMGSYFGDWNNESNFLRASLGSGTILTATYSGFPQYLYFPMALGGTIGDSVKLSQNNFTNTLYAPWGQGWSEVHMALMGDPTLRMHPVRPPPSFSASGEAGKATLSWGASPDSNIVGYHIYRSASANGPFTRVTANPVTGTSYVDFTAAGTYTYMVRAIKLEQSASGTYFNPSQGLFANATVSQGTTLQPPPIPQNFNASLAGTTVTLSWQDVDREDGYKLEQQIGSGSWSEIRTLAAGTTSTSIGNLAAGTQYSYRLRAFNAAGHSDYTPTRTVTTGTSLTPPPIPQNFNVVVSGTTVTISWQDVDREEGYKLEQQVGSGSWSEIRILPSGTTSTSVSNLSAGTQYSYRLRAFNAAGHSDYTPIRTITTGTLLTPPGIPQSFNVAVNGVTVTITWQDVDREDGYKLEQRIGSGNWAEIATLGAGTVTTTLSNLAENTQYSYRLRAFNAAGFSDYTPIRSVTTGSIARPPAAPKNLRAVEVSHDTITVEWDPVPTATKYSIGWRPGSQPLGTYEEVTSTTFKKENLSASTDYYFHVRAMNDAGNSEFSPVITVTTKARPNPVASVSFVGTRTEGGGNWMDYFGAEGFQIAGGTQKAPVYATSKINSAAFHSWTSSTTDPRAALQQPYGATRAAAAWYATSFTIEVNVSGDTARDFALYCLDWDRAGRRQRLEVHDVATGTQLDTRTISSFGNGIYLHYRIRGEVRITLTAEAGANAVVSALLFGPKVPPPINDPLQLSISRGSGVLRLNIQGSSGQRYTIEKTGDFRTWVPVGNGQLSGTSATVNLNWSGEEGLTCFRVKGE